MASLVQLQTWLAEAEEARHKIVTGGGVAAVQRAGRRIEYSRRNLDDLNTYIAELERLIAEAELAASNGGRKRRAIALGWGN